MTEPGPDDARRWLKRWPAGADRVEVWDGRLVFELRGFTSDKTRWDADDISAAERAYPGQRVSVLEAGRLLVVDPPAVGSGA